MKILHVETGRYNFGGPKQVLLTMKGLANLGIENILVCDLNAEIADPASAFATVLKTKISGDLDIGFICRLRKHIKEHKPDIVHLHSRRGADWLGGIATRLEKTPSVLSRRVDNPESRLITKLKYRLFNKVLAISNGIKDVLVSQGMATDRITVIQDAIDTNEFTGPFDRKAFQDEFSLDDDDFVIGVIAQLIHRKGHRHLIKTLPELTSEHPNLKVIFFGRGPKLNDLEERISALSLQDKIVLAGFRTDLQKWIGCLDLVVHPADMEGLGVSLLQAGASGVPLIGSRIGGIPEVIIQDKTGMLIEPGNIDDLKHAIQKTLQNSELRVQLGNAAKAHVEEHFSIDSLVEAHFRLYNQMLI